MLKQLLIALTVTLTLTSCSNSVEKQIKVIKNKDNRASSQEETPKRRSYDFNFIISNPRVTAVETQDSLVEEQTPLTEDTGTLSEDSTKLDIPVLAIPAARTILIEGPIMENVIEAANAIKLLDSRSNDPIYILLDSPGGSVFDGARVVSAMQNAKSPVYTVCLRLCASMAFIIHQYGTKRYMQDRAVLMSHFASTSTGGDVERMKSYIELVQKYVDRFSAEIAERAGLSLEVYRNMISKDLWMTEEEAIDSNFSDGTVDVTVETDFNVGF